MTDWHTTTLADCTEINPRESIGDESPFLAMEDVPAWSRRHQTPKIRTGRSGSRFRDDDTLLARITPCLENGKTCQVSGLGSEVVGRGSTEFIVLRARPGVTDADFIYYLARWPEFREFAIRHMTGTSGRQRVERSALASFPLLLPPESEQRAIAGVLGLLDDKIESNQRLALAAEAILDIRAEQMDGRRVPLGEIVEVDRDPVSPSDLGDVWVDLFSFSAFDSTCRPERVLASAIQSGKSRVVSPSLLLARLNPRFWRLWHAVPEPDRVALSSTEFMVLRPVPGLSVADVWLACSQPAVRQELVQRATGTSGSHQRVRPEDVLSIEISDPMESSEDIRDGCSHLLELATSSRRQIGALDSLRNALLPELLSGRKRVENRGGEMGFAK